MIASLNDASQGNFIVCEEYLPPTRTIDYDPRPAAACVPVGIGCVLVLKFVAGIVEWRFDSAVYDVDPDAAAAFVHGISRSSLMLLGALNPAIWLRHSFGLIDSHSLTPFALVASRR